MGSASRINDVHYEMKEASNLDPSPEPQAVEAKSAGGSTRPVDFTNASPFPNRKKAEDPTRRFVFAAAAVALLAFAVSMTAVLLMQAPAR